MKTFDDLTGNGYAQTNVDFLHSENAQLKVQITALQQEMMQRASPRVAELMDALNQLTAMAATGHPAAKAVLQKFVATLDAVRDAASPIAVVRNAPKT